jgi:hypothetical protein
MSEHVSRLMISTHRLKACLVAAAVITVLALTTPAVRAQVPQEQSAFYIFFKVPAATQTSPVSINNFSSVTGSYSDAKGVTHGFLRGVFGKIAVFDPPGSIATGPSAINDEGAITGNYQDSNHVTHGFVRDPWGHFRRFDPPGSTNTIPTSINAFGAIVGLYFSANGPGAFLRSPDGIITTFEPGGRAEGINLFGAITGFTNGPSPAILVEGFLRSPDGTITPFADPSAASGGTFPTGIDAFGDIAGNYINAKEYQQSFVRDAEGGFTTISPPNSFQTQVNAISELGAIVGFYNEVPLGMGGQHDFVRDTNGNITSFDVPGGGLPVSINNFGVITGSSGTGGFLRVPY